MRGGGAAVVVGVAEQYHHNAQVAGVVQVGIIHLLKCQHHYSVILKLLP